MTPSGPSPSAAVAPIVDADRQTQFLFDTLVSTSAETLQPQPNLAASWVISDDGLTYTFTLAQNVTFHDGEPWNADAAVFNLERYIDTGTDHFYPDLNGQSGASVSGIKSFRAVDELTLEITTKAPWSYLPADLAFVYFGLPWLSARQRPFTRAYRRLRAARLLSPRQPAG